MTDMTTTTMIRAAFSLTVIFSAMVNGLGTSDNQFPFITLGANSAAYSGQMFGDNLYVEDLIDYRIAFGILSSYSSFTISKNGYLYFNLVGPAQSYDEFSSFSTPIFVLAPFWDDMYVGLSGHIKYEIYDDSTGMVLRNQVKDYVNSVVGQSITVNSLLIVEWKNMRSNTLSSAVFNTFQVVIASSGFGDSYAIFTYKCGDLQWSTSSSTIGYKSTGDVYRNHPFSRVDVNPNPIACINMPSSVWSNVVYDIGTPLSCEAYLGYYGCNDGICVPLVRQCDGQYDCIDLSDEIGCTTPTTMGCTATQFTCSNGACVSSSDRCNGQWECSDGSDEAGCGCPSGQFTCNTGDCISSSYHCDGSSNCPDGSDEYNCPSTSTCTVRQYKCSSGECISSSSYCNGYSDCPDGSDEYNCPSTSTCTVGQYTCSSGECISSSNYCNGYSDCPDGSDELVGCGSTGLSIPAIAGIASGVVLVGGGLLCVAIIVAVVVGVVLYQRKNRSVAFQRFDCGPSQVQYSNTRQQVGFDPPPQYSVDQPAQGGLSVPQSQETQTVDLKTAASDSSSNFSSDVEDSSLLKQQ